jgi:hypothetical protein
LHYLSFILEAKTQSRETHVLTSILQANDIIFANLSMDIRLYTRKQMLGRYRDIDYRDMCYHQQTYTEHDMYLADNTSKIREYVATGHISGKQQKYDSGSGATKLYVQSDGFSYSGKYIDEDILISIIGTCAIIGKRIPIQYCFRYIITVHFWFICC